MNQKTTMDSTLESVLKDDLMQDFYFESDGQAVKVYGKLAGLANLGKTYFTNWGEIQKADQYARGQLKQTYGDEVFGKSAQLKGQQGDGTGDIQNESGELGSLIDCRVSFLMDLPEKKKFLKEAKGTYENFIQAINQLQKYIQKKVDSDEDWKKSHEQGNAIQTLNNAIKKFNRSTGPQGDDNVQAFNAIYEVFGKEPWKSDLLDKKFKTLADNVLIQWKDWGGEAPSEFGKSVTPQKDKASSGGQETSGWHWEHAYRIDIKTNFDANWYKRKFKSGLLNAAIMTLKTAARSRVSAGGETDMSHHKYTADEMLPQDEKRLNGIQWKMTNKVAQDYITLLLGWSRKKEKYIDEKTDKPLPKQETLEIDSAFGGQLAKKALSNRGILGRLRQKLFAGGQTNNVISVAFQMADPNDGWKLVDEKTGKEVDTGDEENAQGEEKAGKGNSSKTPTAGADAENGEKAKGKDKDLNDPTLLQRVEKIEGKMTDNDLWGKVPHPQQSAKESFVGNDKLMGAVRLVCEGGMDVGKMVDEFLIGED